VHVLFVFVAYFSIQLTKFKFVPFSFFSNFVATGFFC